MSEGTLHCIIRTPEAIILESDVSAVRVPTESGQVGLRPRAEPCVLAVEPGLIVFRQDDSMRYAGTAGGLLYCHGTVASLLTPLAVVGADVSTVLEALEQALAVPSAEQELRTALGRLETSILQEMQQGEAERLSVIGREH